MKMKVTFVGFRYIVEYVSVMRKKNAEMYLVKKTIFYQLRHRIRKTAAVLLQMNI